MVILVKGLGGGLLIGVCLVVGLVVELLILGLYGSIFGGNLVCVVVVLVVLWVLVSDGLVCCVEVLGKLLWYGIEVFGYLFIDYVCGCGLLLGIVLIVLYVKDVEVIVCDVGYLVNVVVFDVIWLVLLLIIVEV